MLQFPSGGVAVTGHPSNRGVGRLETQFTAAANERDPAFFLERYAKAMHRAREKDAGIMDALVGQVPGQSGTKDGHQAEAAEAK